MDLAALQARVQQSEHAIEYLLRKLAQAERDLLRAQQGLREVERRVPLGPALDNGLRLVQAPTGGIAPLAVESCQLYDSDFTTLLDEFVDVTNPATNWTAPEGEKVWIGTVNGVPDSIVNWECVVPA